MLNVWQLNMENCQVSDRVLLSSEERSSWPLLHPVSPGRIKGKEQDIDMDLACPVKKSEIITLEQWFLNLRVTIHLGAAY